MADADRIEIARWYTAGRRFPRLMGRLSDGTPIPGGPYTIQQLAVFVVGLLALNMTRSVWGVFGTLINFALMFALPWLAAKALGLFAWGRNPVTIAHGFVQLMSTPRAGRVNGRPVTAPRPTGPPRGAAVSAHVFRTPAPSEPATLAAPEPDSVLEVELAPLTGVQQLLAGRNNR